MTAETRWIVVLNWDRFQHYKDRTPLWIKSYTELMADRNYISLTLRQRGMLHGIWLLYAASRRDLGANVAQLGRMLGEETVRTRDLEALSDAGFIRVSDSAPLAEQAQPASPDLEVEVEEKNKSLAVALSPPGPLGATNGKPDATHQTQAHKTVAQLIDESLTQSGARKAVA